MLLFRVVRLVEDDLSGPDALVFESVDAENDEREVGDRDAFYLEEVQKEVEADDLDVQMLKAQERSLRGTGVHQSRKSKEFPKKSF